MRHGLDGVHTGRHREGVAHKSAGEQAHSGPKGDYQQPHRVHTSAERNAAQARKHAQELLDEAARHHINLDEHVQMQAVEEAVEDTKLKGVNLDDERKKRGKRDQEGDTDQQHEETAEEAAARALGSKDGSGKYFQDLPEDRMGDLSLTDPNQMKRALGPSVRFAQHAMLLAAERMKEGMPREEALQFLASLYLGVADREYARKALREFGPATGIIDLYPLEVMKHLLEHVPSFMSKISAAKFLAAQPTGGYKSETGKPIVLKYDPDLRIRGFAIKGGQTPGYVFEPVDPPGTYHLTFASPGKFMVMLSALSKSSGLMIEEFEVTITQGKESLDEASASVMSRAKSSMEELDPSATPPAQTSAGSESGENPAVSGPAEPAKKKKKDDLKFVIPRKI
ncbi:MAG: hypothetical protein U1E65_31440 [Myxococcota bacterium]